MLHVPWRPPGAEVKLFWVELNILCTYCMNVAAFQATTVRLFSHRRNTSGVVMKSSINCDSTSTSASFLIVRGVRLSWNLKTCQENSLTTHKFLSEAKVERKVRFVWIEFYWVPTWRCIQWGFPVWRLKKSVWCFYMLVHSEQAQWSTCVCLISVIYIIDVLPTNPESRRWYSGHVLCLRCSI